VSEPDRLIDRAWRFSRALIVGGCATLVDFSVLAFCIRVLAIAPTTARAPALVAGALVQFFGNRSFTFRAQHGRLSRQARLFAAMEVVMLVLNWAVFRLVQPRLGFLPPELVGFLGTFFTFAAFAYPFQRLVIFRRPTSHRVG
jgi:putative flippase GtrA